MLYAGANAGLQGAVLGGGFALNPFPELVDASVLNFGLAAAINQNVGLSLGHNSFNSGDIINYSDTSGSATTNIVSSTSVVNVYFKGSRSDIYKAVNVEFINVYEESVVAIGFGVAGSSILVDNSKRRTELFYSGAINGANFIIAYFAQVFDFSFKEPPSKGVLNFSINQKNKKVGWGFGGYNAGISIMQGLNYGNTTYIRLGGEANMAKFFWLRAGYFMERFKQNDFFYGPTYGAGLEVPILGKGEKLNLQLDWAAFPYPDFVESFVLPGQSANKLPSGTSNVLSATICFKW